MNERIKELVKQATTEEHDGFLYFDKKKFAELIVGNVAPSQLKWERAGTSLPETRPKDKHITQVGHCLPHIV